MNEDLLAGLAQDGQPLAQLPEQRGAAGEARQVQGQARDLVVAPDGVEDPREVEPGQARVVEPAVLLVGEVAALQVEGDHPGRRRVEARCRGVGYRGARRVGFEQVGGVEAVAVRVVGGQGGEAVPAEGETQAVGGDAVVARGVLAQAQAQAQPRQRLHGQAAAEPASVQGLAAAQHVVAEDGKPGLPEGTQGQVQRAVARVRLHRLHAGQADGQGATRPPDLADRQGLFAGDLRAAAGGPAPGDGAVVASVAAGEADLPVGDAGEAGGSGRVGRVAYRQAQAAADREAPVVQMMVGTVGIVPPERRRGPPGGRPGGGIGEGAGGAAGRAGGGRQVDVGPEGVGEALSRLGVGEGGGEGNQHQYRDQRAHERSPCCMVPAQHTLAPGRVPARSTEETRMRKPWQDGLGTTFLVLATVATVVAALKI